MITLFSSNSYTSADYKWLAAVLNTGMVYSSCSEAPDCPSCEHKNACGDMVRFYRFVSNKAESGVDRRGKRQAD